MALTFTNLLELEEMARSKIAHASFDYIAGGAEDEVSLRRNREAYDHWALRPRVLVDVSRRDASTTILGQRVSMPILVAPTAFHGLVHPEGEVATARGVAAAGTLMVASVISTRTLEDIAASVPAPRWFQLYVYKDRQVTADLVRRAERTGYRAICLTVDTPLLGRRERPALFDSGPRHHVRKGVRQHHALSFAMLQLLPGDEHPAAAVGLHQQPGGAEPLAREAPPHDLPNPLPVRVEDLEPAPIGGYAGRLAQFFFSYSSGM